MDITPDLIKRAWTDADVRAGLPDDVRSALPEAPEGVGRMDDEQLAAAAGGAPAPGADVAPGAMPPGVGAGAAPTDALTGGAPDTAPEMPGMGSM